MGLFQTFCGFYCSMVALVGIYFFVVLAVMEFRHNQYFVQVLQHLPMNDTDKNTKDNGIAFLVLAVVQVVLAGACFACGNSSMKKDQAEKQRQIEANLVAYQGVANQEM